MINDFGAYLGMGMLAITVAIMWFLADRDENEDEPENKNKFRRKTQRRKKYNRGK